MKKKLFVACLCGLSLFIFTTVAFAHDGYWGDANVPLEIDWIGSTSELDLNHDDANDWKGYATLTVKNVCGEDWGDFHLKLRCSWGGDVNFDDTPPPQLWLREGYTWQEYEELRWLIDNEAAGGATMDLFFDDNPIGRDETAKIRVYTNNTAHHWTSFKVSVYPTPVPEPATLILLGLGAAALIRRK